MIVLAIVVAVLVTILFSEAGAVIAGVLLLCMVPSSWYIIFGIIFGIFFVLGLLPDRNK